MATVLLLIVAAVTASTSSVWAQGPATDDPPSDELVLDAEMELRGDDAVDALEAADATDDIAAGVDLTGDELVSELRSDDAMFVTGGGHVGYVDELALGASSTSAPDSPMLLPAGVDPFNLNSKPGVGKVIYLDFNGHTTTGTPWNSQFTDGADIVSAPYGGSDDQIYEIWQRVAEDFLPFDVNVTTADPGVEGLRRTSPGDANYGQRMVVSPSNWYGQTGVIGIAFLDVFDESSDIPGFVFATSPSAKVLGEAVSHETGHTLGLLHDGVHSTAYYDGHGQWAPIMGRSVSDSKPVTQWSKGDYPGANNQENDIAKIASYVGYRADDVSSSGSAPTPVGAGTTVGGTIGAGGDIDVFAVDVAAGPLGATVTPLASWSNLLARVSVCDAGGNLVAVGNPASASSWSSVASVSVPAGRYTIEVSPIGWLTTADGFSDYGSMGAYQLAVTGSAAAPSATPTRGCSSRLQPVTPNRVLDTRVGTGGYRRVAGGQQAVVQIAGTSGVPYGATAAVVNITAVGPSGQGFLTAYPCTPGVPDASNVNYVAGQIVANSTIAALSPTGQLCVWTYASTDILVDVTGWLGATGTSRLTPAGPDRVVDTRRAIGGTRLPAGATMQVDFSGRVPAGTTAVSFNLTAVGASAPGFMTAYPCGQSLPDTSTVNFWTSEARPNNAIVGLGAGNRICIYTYAETEVIVDLTGYFSASGLSYQPTVPTRVLDTRGGTVRPPVGAQTTLSYGVAVVGLGSLDPDAAFVNVTAVDHPREGFVTTFDCGALPDASTVNQRLGQANANGAIVPLTAGSTSCAWLSDAGHLIVDLNGWWVR